MQGAAVAGRAQGNGYDLSGVLADVAPVIAGADLAICHLETPLAAPEGPFEGYPSFAVQPQIVDALAGAGYDTCSTASNHSLDAGFAGLVRTLDTLDAYGVGHTGTFRAEQGSRRRTSRPSTGYGLPTWPGPTGSRGYRSRRGSRGRSTTSTRRCRRSRACSPRPPAPARRAPR